MKKFYIVLLLIVLYHILKQLLTKGTIDRAFIISENEKRQCLLLLIDYETIMIGRGNMLSFHTLKLMKIDLQDISLKYETKITRYASKMADDRPLDIFGMNETHIFIKTQYDNLLVIDYRNGKVQGNRKRIEKKNPRLKGFVIESCTYSDSLNSVVIYDRQGYPYLLDAQNIVAEPIDSKTAYSDSTTPKLLKLEDIPSILLMKYEPGITITPIAYSKRNYVRFVHEKGSDKYYVRLRHKHSNEKHEYPKNFFINPELISTEEGGSPYLDTEPPSIIIVHRREPDSMIDGVFVSRVNGKSEELWRQEIKKIAVRPTLSEASNLYLIELGNRLCFLYLKEPKMSISVVDKYSGDIIKGPKLFVSRQIYGLFR